MRAWISGVARILFLGGPGQKWAGTRPTNWSSPVRKSAAPNRELNGGWVEGLVIHHNILNMCFKPGRRANGYHKRNVQTLRKSYTVNPFNLSRFTHSKLEIENLTTIELNLTLC